MSDDLQFVLAMAISTTLVIGGFGFLGWLTGPHDSKCGSELNSESNIERGACQ